jgi:hypothetical protein
LRGIGHSLERDVIAVGAGWIAPRRDLPDVRDLDALRDLLAERRHLDRGRKPDIDQARQAARGAEHVANICQERGVWLARDERDPQRAVDGVSDQIEASGNGDTADEHWRRDVVARLLLAEVVHLRQRTEDRRERRELGVIGPALVEARGSDR